MLFFTANDGTHGIELWKSDGTASGTVLVKDIYSGSDSSYPNDFVAVGNTLYFGAGVQSEGLWKSDGTEDGTVVAMANASIGVTGSGGVAAAGNTVYFAANAISGNHGMELYALDPTNITFGELLKYTFDFKLQVLEQLYPIFPSEDSADLAIDEPMVNITFQYDLKSAGTMVNQNIALTHRATCAIVENGSVACWGRGQLYSLGNGGDANTGEPILTSPMPDNRPAVAICRRLQCLCSLG